MIPVCLNLRNFMSYTDVHEPLRFEGIHVAVLAGDNGHGKSALLDAITWALWGESRARSPDDLIHTGATDMEVEFEFLLDSQPYRVLRKRQKRGKHALATLDFFVHASGGWRSLTERSANETQKAILRTLRMSYETFTSSSFIQQGRADAFTTSQPADRKRILAEILQLGIFDELEAKAKDAVRQRELQLRDERARVEEWEREIARTPQYQAEVDRLKAELAVFEEQAHELEGQCNVLRERVARLELARRALEEARERLARHTAERERAQTTLREATDKLALAQDVLDRAEAIEQAGAELARVRAALEAADATQQAYLPLARQRDRAQATLETERARLEAHLTALGKQVTEYQAMAAGREQLEAEKRQAEALLHELRELETERASVQTAAITCREQAAEKRSENRQLKAQMEELKARIGALEAMASCPSCQRPMDASHKATLRAAYEREGREQAAAFRANEQAYRALEARVARDDQRLSALAERLAGLPEAQRRLAEVESGLKRLAEAERRLAETQASLTEHSLLLEEARFAPEARDALRQAEARLAALGYDEAAHQALRQQAQALAGADLELRTLERARDVAEHLRAQERAAQASIARLDEDIEVERRQCQRFEQDQAALDGEQARLQTLQAQLQQARAGRDRLREALGMAQQALDHARFAERQRDESVARQDTYRREMGLFGELAAAFGKKGVQAMIIETALPEIEEEANRLLARMTDGRMHVKLETQRDAKVGGGTIETLDIKIADELGTRSYEMFSGGESFRVNFAIRVALSRLLAHRAGTKLQTLVVDEGFGSQDAEGRDRLVEAIQAIQPDFEKILVITHIEDLRDRFPVRIEVRKTPQGSTFTLR